MSDRKLRSIQSRVYRRLQAKVFHIWDEYASKTATQLMKPCSHLSGPVRHIRHIYVGNLLAIGEPAIWSVKPGFHIIAPVATIAAVVEKRVSETVAIYGNTLFSDSSDKYDSDDERR